MEKAAWKGIPQIVAIVTVSANGRISLKKAVRQHLGASYPEWFVVRDSVELLESGLLGKPIADETYARAGELIVLPRGAGALQHTQPSVALVGRHGGLTPEEMLVPLIGARLEALV